MNFTEWFKSNFVGAGLSNVLELGRFLLPVWTWPCIALEKYHSVWQFPSMTNMQTHTHTDTHTSEHTHCCCPVNPLRSLFVLISFSVLSRLSVISGNTTRQQHDKLCRGHTHSVHGSKLHQQDRVQHSRTKLCEVKAAQIKPHCLHAAWPRVRRSFSRNTGRPSYLQRTGPCLGLGLHCAV